MDDDTRKVEYLVPMGLSALEALNPLAYRSDRAALDAHMASCEACYDVEHEAHCSTCECDTTDYVRCPEYTRIRDETRAPLLGKDGRHLRASEALLLRWQELSCSMRPQDVPGLRELGMD